MTYIARAGSLTEKAIAVLATNAGDPLTRQQIAAGVGCNPASVEGLLEIAVKHGAVTKHADFGTFRWSVLKGTKAPTIVAAETPVGQGVATAPVAAAPKAKKAKPARKAKAPTAKRTTPAKPKKRAKPKKQQTIVEAALAAVEEAKTLIPTFGLFSDGSLEMKRAGDTVFSIGYIETLELIRYLVSQKALVDELFPQGTEAGA